ncbi:MAG: hypothetical protein IJX94_05150 [Clostridia bacterium]|nr:hypothetical protein [Clostridia bacterium]
MFIEVRSEYDKGKLLFKWDPERNLVSVVSKDTLYCVELGRDERKGNYRIVEKTAKKIV